MSLFTRVALRSRRMTHTVVQNLVFVLLLKTISAGCSVTSLSYDYSSSIECLPEPHKPQYEGGIIRNAEFNNGLKGWSGFGYSEIAEKRSKTGNRFAAVSNKVQPYQNISQKVFLHNWRSSTPCLRGCGAANQTQL